jgi:hypothetical protein
VTVAPPRPPGRKPIYVPFRRRDFRGTTKPANGLCSYPSCASSPKWARLGGTGNLAYCTRHARKAAWPLPEHPPKGPFEIETPEPQHTKPSRWRRLIGGRR